MNKKVFVDDSLADSLADFLKTDGIQLDLTKDDCSDLKIMQNEDIKKCDVGALYSGGWIPCSTALTLAKKLQITTLQTGSLLNHLKIKIKHCSLGCF